MKNTARTKILRITDSLGDKAEIESFESFLLQMDHAGVLSVKGCVGIREYTAETIVLECEARVIEVSGDALYVKQFAPAETLIGGLIIALRFHKGEAV